VRPDLADIDDWAGVNSNDLQRIANYILQGGIAPTCDPGLEPPFPPSEDTLELRNCRVPAHSDTWTVELWLTTTGADGVEAVVFPFRLVDSLSLIVIDSIVANHPAETLDSAINIDPSQTRAIAGWNLLMGSPLPGSATSKLATIYLSNTYSESVEILLIDTISYRYNTTLISRNGGAQPSVPSVVGIESNLGPYAPSCFGEMRGNADCDVDETISISDLIVLVDYMFSSGPTPACFDEADVSADGQLVIEDLIFLVDYMFNGGPAPLPCP
jgi:hypothetical protein